MNKHEFKAQLDAEVRMIQYGDRVRRMQAADIFPDVAERYGEI